MDILLRVVQARDELSLNEGRVNRVRTARHHRHLELVTVHRHSFAVFCALLKIDLVPVDELEKFVAAFLKETHLSILIRRKHLVYGHLSDLLEPSVFLLRACNAQILVAESRGSSRCRRRISMIHQNVAPVAPGGLRLLLVWQVIGP